jgi:hypothetical protein
MHSVMPDGQMLTVRGPKFTHQPPWVYIHEAHLRTLKTCIVSAPCAATYVARMAAEQPRLRGSVGLLPRENVNWHSPPGNPTMSCSVGLYIALEWAEMGPLKGLLRKRVSPETSSQTSVRGRIS